MVDAPPPSSPTLFSTSIDVPFSGEGAGEAALTWGQRAMAAAMRRERSWMPMGGHRPVPPGTTLADVAAELRYTMERYQSFRTRLALPPAFDLTEAAQSLPASFAASGGASGGASGAAQPVAASVSAQSVTAPGAAHSVAVAGAAQSVAASGMATLDVAEADGSDPNDIAAAVESFYRNNSPNLSTSWPMRMAVICQHGTPARLVAIMPHIVTDGLGAAVMIDEVTRRLATPVEGLRPLDIAAWQASPSGARQHAAALRHWERHAATLEPLTPTATPPSPRYRKCVLESPRLAARLAEAAARTGVDGSTVLLAAYCMALAHVTGHANVAVRQIVSNRFRAGLSTVVSPITQLGLCVIDRPASLDEAIAVVARAALPAQKYAYYDPLAVPDVATPCFNDRRSTGTATTAFGDPAKADRTGVVEWLAPPPGPTEPLFLHADDVPGAVRITLDADLAYFSPAEVEAIAYTMVATAGPRAPINPSKP